MKETKRNTALDLVRITAAFFVISYHYLAWIGFTDVYMVGGRMYLLCVIRTMFSSCVPLFFMLTGYLMRKKRLSGRFYLGIVKTLAIYAMASVVCYYLDNGRLDWEFAKNMLYGAGTGYSWYIRTYTGLFLLIPFLNMMYHGNFALQNEANVKKYKLVLIGTLVYLTALPSVANSFVFSWEWWKHPSISKDYVTLMSEAWTRMYPITYYIIGSYLAEYGLKMRRRTCGLLLVAVIIAKGSYDFYRSDGMEYAFGIWQGYESLYQVIQAVLMFNFIATTNTQHFHSGVKKTLQVASDLCLGVYLISEVSEEFFYPMLLERVESVGHRLMYYPIMAPLVFLSSMVLSGGLNLIYEGIRRLLALRQKAKA